LKLMPPAVTGPALIVTVSPVPPLPNTAGALLTQNEELAPFDHLMSVRFQFPGPSTGLVGLEPLESQVSCACAAVARTVTIAKERTLTARQVV